MVQFLEATAASTTGSLITLLLPMAIIIVFMYLIMYLPQRKQEKKDAEMRNSIDVGDEVVTIGGVVGRVAAIDSKNDTIVVETTSDRVKIRFRRAAISSVNKLDGDAGKDKDKDAKAADAGKKKESAPLKK